jgi:hypothetical protein
VRGDRLGAAGFAVIIVLLATASWFVRWTEHEPRTYGDTYWYARDAMQFGGRAQPDLDAGIIECDGRHYPKPRKPGCAEAQAQVDNTFSPRYVEIFDARPGYGLLSAPLVRLFGRDGFAATTALCAIGSGVAVAGLVSALGLGRVRAALATLVYYQLPTGYWGTRLMSETPMMLFLVLGLLGAVLLLRGDDRAPPARRALAIGTAMTTVGMAGEVLVRSSTGLTLAVATFAIGAAVALQRRHLPRNARLGPTILAGVSLATIAIQEQVAVLLGLPGLSTSIQDTLTEHFVLPDAPHPWSKLLDQAGELWTHEVPRIISHQPVQYVVLAVGLVGLVLRLRRDIAGLLLLACATGPVLATLHPVYVHFTRITVVVWVPAIVGLVALIPDRWLRRASGRTTGRHAAGVSPA